MAHNLFRIMIDTCGIRVTVGEAEIAQNQIPLSALMQAFPGCSFGCGFGDDQEDVTVADDHNGRQEMLHDFNGIVSIGLTRSSSLVTA
jgi:hypothetical protein